MWCCQFLPEWKVDSWWCGAIFLDETAWSQQKLSARSISTKITRQVSDLCDMVFVLIKRVFLHYDWYFFLSIPISARQRLLSFNIIPIGGGFTDDSTNSAGSDTQFNLPQFHCYQCLHPHGIREKANFENNKQQV